LRIDLKALLIAMMVSVVVGAANGQAAPVSVVRAKSIWSIPVAHRGDRRVLAVVLDMDGGYHVNPSRAQLHDNFLIPTQLKVVEVSSGVTVGLVQYPTPGPVVVGPVDQPRQTEGYENRVVLYVPVEVSAAAQLGESQLILELVYQACDRTQCFAPTSKRLSSLLQVVDESVPIDESVDEVIFAAFNPQGRQDVDGVVGFNFLGLGFSLSSVGWLGFLMLLLTAGLGGLMLNFTPCVLPVIPLKIMGLSHTAGNRARCLTLGVFMSLGVVVFWLGLGLMIATVSGFTATNQLFQYPLFTITVGLVIGAMAVGMFGVFSVRLPKAIALIDPKHDTLGGSFGFGVMTAVLSTPCTAPLMGAAAAWATTQHAGTTLVVFGAIGVGMALPYLVLSAWPVLIERMPRTGPASELIKQVMGLLMFAVAAYFVGVGVVGMRASGVEPSSLAYWWPVMGFVGAAGAWLAYRTARITGSIGRRFVFMGLGGALLAGSVYGGIRLTDTGPIDWVYYTPDRFAAAQRDGKAVVMDFTAEWCLNCKWLEKNVLNQPSVVGAIEQEGVVAMKVDLTGKNEAGGRMLKRVGRVAIPLLVVFDSDGSEIFKGDFYTARQVVEAVRNAKSQSVGLNHAD
jgi:thiol:disulfide interchange protein DsbD